MKSRRVVALFAVALLAYSVVLGRLYITASNREYGETAQAQTVTTLSLQPQRGDFFDCQGRDLTGYGTEYYALSIPAEGSYTRLFEHVSYREQALLYQRRNAAVPFLIRVDEDLSGIGVYTYARSGRYWPVPAAVHLVGYLDGDGKGVSGLELAFDEALTDTRGSDYVQCVTNASGQLMEEQPPRLTRTEEPARGVMLTLDLGVQRACEAVARQSIQKGCILVLDRATGRVLASVSVPTFDPEDVAASIQADDTSLLNRPLCAFNVGSVFKPVMAALALEKDLDWFTWECTGSTEINGHVYHCAGGIAHGHMNLDDAVAESCNCYFIQLGQLLGGEAVHEMAERFGFGQPIGLAEGLSASAGNLPDPETLQNKGQLAGMSFGQGQLLATPLQVAAMVNTLANGGTYIAPWVVEGLCTADGARLTEPADLPAERRLLDETTARRLQGMLRRVVEEGTGQAAKDLPDGAAGKTGTAQTGRYDSETGEEFLDLWFAGWYPAEEPRYTVLVLQDSITAATQSCAELFAQVCQALYWLENS